LKEMMTTPFRGAMLSLENVILNKQHSLENLTVVSKIKERCADIERVSDQMSLWFSRLFWTPPQPVDRDLEPLLGNPPRDLQSLMTFLFEGIPEILRASHEQLLRILPTRNRTNLATIWFPYFGRYLPFALACRFFDADFFGDLQERIDCFAFLCHAA